MAALKQPTIKVVAIIAEGVPESNTKQLIAYAKANNKVNIFWFILELYVKLKLIILNCMKNVLIASINLGRLSLVQLQ